MAPSILVTGGCGFIGSNFILDWYEESGSPLVNLDALTYAGNEQNLDELRGSQNYRFIRGDISTKETCKKVFREFRPRFVVHFAAESHVDRSIESAEVFLDTNIMGTHQLLEAALDHWKELEPKEADAFRLIHVSTDEVYGSLEKDEPAFTEKNQYQPNSPYAASKAASDHLARAWHHTHKLPVIITNCSNNYGPYQFPEKLIPLVIINALSGKQLPIYGDGQQIRDWLYVKDHCSALRHVLEKGRVGEVYNIGGGNERSNLEVVNTICSILDEVRPAGRVSLKSTDTGEAVKKYSELIRFVKDRPGHDRRYAINSTKLKRELNWSPAETFESGIRKTVEWYLDHPDWLESVQSGAYRDWTKRQYAL